MKLRKRNAFTLIELVAVLVITAIIVLIVTPLVMSIIRKARISADKRSIDAYGRSIELAIAGYLMDNGSFPTSIEQLIIEYSGDEVVCTTTNLNSDSSIYLAGCTVAGRSVEGYTYGKEETVTYAAYEVGDEITYNNVDYYVIKNSGTKESTVTLLKAEPLSVKEVNEYGGAGTENNHVNKFTQDSTETAYDINGYGGIVYYSSETCYNGGPSSGCQNAYLTSDIKYIVDAWKTDQALAAIEARLITKDEYINMCDMETYETPTEPGVKYVPQYYWLYSRSFKYLTMTPFGDSSNQMWEIDYSGNINAGGSVVSFYVIRPVIVLDKSVL